MPSFMDPAAAAKVLQSALSQPDQPFTVADAAAKSGLALRDVENGLNALSHEYRGRMRVGEKGHLVHFFPTGFNKPWETREWFETAAKRAFEFGLGATRFIVRAWVATVLVGYVALFVAIFIAMTLSRGNDNDSNRRGGLGGAEVLFRIVADALFWTFHPFSPFRYQDHDYQSGRSQRTIFGNERDAVKVPFYEKVHRFLFGPTIAKEGPLEEKKRLVQHIRAQRGRIGLADVMRVSGMSREQADPLMARLMLDYDGSVDVSEDGGIYYTFSELRVSTEQRANTAASIWDRPLRPLPLTGNHAGDNVLIGLLNLFNLGASAFAMTHALTIHNVTALFTARRGHPPVFIDSGTPLVLGLIPLVFSILLFALPLSRLVLSQSKAKTIKEENGRRAILKTVLESIAQKRAVTNDALVASYLAATGETPASTLITKRIVDLGGDVDMNAAEQTGEIRYRFADLEIEAEALDEERKKASEQEQSIGRIVFDA